jgi:hypothetical protein
MAPAAGSGWPDKAPGQPDSLGPAAAALGFRLTRVPTAILSR